MMIAGSRDQFPQSKVLDFDGSRHIIREKVGMQGES